VTSLPETSYFDSTVSFAMARTGRVSTIVLGAFQVAANGDLANWNVPATGAGGIGGAMDLAAGGGRVIAMTFHREKNGSSKVVQRLTYPPTALGCVACVVTDLAYFDIDANGFLLREVAPGVRVDDVRAATDAEFRVAGDLREMQF
jgi:3-oxoacid CoA-transferase subunit B